MEDRDQDYGLDDEFDDEGGDTGAPELTPEVAALVEQAKAEARQEYALSLSQQLSPQGLDIHPDRGIVITDPHRVREFFQPLGGGQELLPPAPVTQQAAGQAVDEDPMPDVYADPDAYTKWQDRRVQKSMQTLLQQQAAQYEAKINALESAFTSREAQFAAQSAKVSLAQDPRWSDLAEHPEFEARFAEALSTVPRDQWADPASIKGVAGWLTAYLPTQPQQTQSKQQTPRDDGGRFTADPAWQAQVARSTLDQARPAQGVSNAGRSPEVTEEERAMCQYFGCSPAELRALGDGGTGEAYYKAKARREAQQKAGVR